MKLSSAEFVLMSWKLSRNLLRMRLDNPSSLTAFSPILRMVLDGSQGLNLLPCCVFTSGVVLIREFFSPAMLKMSSLEI